MVETREAENKVRLKALRDAARVGIADIEAGRFSTFETTDQIRRHLDAITDDVISQGAGRKSPT
jgi:antitoxin ParD1/3/4